MIQKLFIIIIFLMANVMQAQKLNVKDIEMPISKEAKKKGMYVNTTLTDEGNIRTFISYDLKKRLSRYIFVFSSKRPGWAYSYEYEENMPPRLTCPEKWNGAIANIIAPEVIYGIKNPNKK